MKLIILDHFRRWWWALVIVLGVYFTFQAFVVRESPQSNDKTTDVIDSMIHTVHSVFIYQAVMWLGFLLLWDFQRGFSRVLTSLPVTAKQIGRALWLAAVALPAIALAIAGLLAFLIFSSEVSEAPRLEKILTEGGFIALYLGATFGALTFMRTTNPDTAIDRILTVLSNLLLLLVMFGFTFSQIEPLSLLETALIFTVYGIFTVLGWFRAERMVLRRAGFNRIAPGNCKKSTQHHIPQGSGGLLFLVQRTFTLTTLAGLAVAAWMIFAMSFFTHSFSHDDNRVQTIMMMINQGANPYVFFVLLFSIVPIAFQLRLLRTLPVSPSALAIIMVFLPVLSIATAGATIISIAYFVAGKTVILPATNSVIMLGAKIAIIVPLIVWRGLNAWSYTIILLIVLSDMFISLGLTQEHPLWINLTIFALCLVTAFMLTYRLITKSSCAYRPRTMPATAWNMMRR